MGTEPMARQSPGGVSYCHQFFLQLLQPRPVLPLPLPSSSFMAGCHRATPLRYRARHSNGVQALAVPLVLAAATSTGRSPRVCGTAWTMRLGSVWPRSLRPF